MLLEGELRPTFCSKKMAGEGVAVQSSSRGVSPQGIEQLSREPLSTYLLGSGKRWGALMVFPDLRRSEVGAAWQRDPIFHEFREVMRRGRSTTLTVVILWVASKSPMGR